MKRVITSLAATVAIVLIAPCVAVAQTYPPVDTPGPALSVPQGTLDAALECSGDLTGAAEEPVLLVPGTTLTPEHNFGWNWIPALDALGRGWCTVELPGSAMADVQVAGEYVVNAIRTMHADYGDRIDVLGHSQGGMLPRWALRFWPDTRAMVDDQVGIAPSNHGTTFTIIPCALFQCAPAFWQQTEGSAFINALNSHQETFAGIDYTAIYTTADTTVTPNANDDGSSSLRPGDSASVTNVSVQEVCPTTPSMSNQGHLLVGMVSKPAYLLAVDALADPGPAGSSPLAEADCNALYMPGIDPMTGVASFSAAQTFSNNNVNTYPKVASEPALACYAVVNCGVDPGAGTPTPPPGDAKPAATGRRAAALKKCKKKKKGRARANCLKKAKKLPV
jgi:triacylglycerol esterase/lipase EstA (alpha/beta hydrolase family)